MAEPRVVTVYIDYKSPYAYLAKDPAYQLECDFQVRLEWLPYVLDIPSFLGSARLDADGGVLEENRNAHQWRRVRYSYMDCRRQARKRGLVIRGPRKIWDSTLAAAGMLYAQRTGDGVFRRYHDAVFERFWRRELDIEDVDVIAAVLDRRMAQDSSIIVLGEDVHRLNGGTNGATKGLAKRYPGRIIGTPISENAFAGTAGGIALDGRFRPVVEFMYADFLWVAADQLFNQIGKARHMFGGQNDVPLVLRVKVAMGTGYGSQHSMDPAGIFATAPGWRVVAPSTPFDYVGLMNSALALGDPVVVLEHVDLYSSLGQAPTADLDYQLPFGKAALRRTGQDATIISYLSMVNHVLEAVEHEGLDADVIDLRWLDRASLDWETIEESVRKTNAVLIVEQGAVGTSYGGWLADEIQRRLFDWLDQPVQRVTGAEASPSISKVLERAAFARTEETAAGIRRLVAGMGG
jgi:2-oxoisovalerate dehydrogenase E1 component